MLVHIVPFKKVCPRRRWRQDRWERSPLPPPWARVKHLAALLRNRENGQQYSSIHEDWGPKIVEDTEKSDRETIKPQAVKRPELDANRGHPNNRGSETNFTLLLQRT